MNLFHQDNSAITNNDFENRITDNRLLFIGIGIILWWIIGGVSYLIDNFIRDLFLVTNMSPLIIIWSGLIIRILASILGLVISLRLIKNCQKTDLTIFRNVLIILITTKLIEFIYPLAINALSIENYYENMSNYLDYLNKESFIQIIGPLKGVLTTILLVIIIYRNRKKYGG